jgi:5'-AMP-activated protein kinase catalytic alpha subunit
MNPIDTHRLSLPSPAGVSGMGKISRLLLGRYELGRLLVMGTFAKVYHACNVGTREEVAIKIMDKDHLSKLGAVRQ